MVQTHKKDYYFIIKILIYNALSFIQPKCIQIDLQSKSLIL